MVDIRAKVMSMYPNATWAAKVSRMPDSQVFAIFSRNREKEGRLDAETSGKKDDAPYGGYHQMNIWEWLNNKKRNADA